MKNMTYEKSVEAAIPIKKMNEAAEELDIEYLTEALKEMRENHFMRESMAILNPSPFTHNEQQELNRAKLKQLELMISLAENVIRIKELTINLHHAKTNENSMSRMFGL